MVIGAASVCVDRRLRTEAVLERRLVRVPSLCSCCLDDVTNVTTCVHPSICKPYFINTVSAYSSRKNRYVCVLAAFVALCRVLVQGGLIQSYFDAVFL